MTSIMSLSKKSAAQGVRVQLMNLLRIKDFHITKSDLTVWLPIVLCTLYLSYRYPLQINSSLTSPSYSDTPFVFQVGKFVMVLPFLVISTRLCFSKNNQLRHWLIILAVQYLFIFALFKTVTTGSTGYLEVSFWLQFSLILAWGADEISTKAVDRFLRFLLFYALGTNLIEIILFIAFGRLPALAYKNSFSVRFGGFLDDPNGFAALLFLLMGWTYGRFRGKTRNLLLASIIVALLITQSLTAVLFFALILVVWIMVTFIKRPIPVIIVTFFFIGIVACIARFIPASLIAIAQTMLESKQGSVDGHVFPWTELAPRWPEWILHGGSAYGNYEFWWGGALVNFGAPWALIDFALIIFCLWAIKSAYSSSNPEQKPVYLGLLLFGAYFMVGSFNLPFSQVFPINVLFFVFSFLIIFRKIDVLEANRTPPI